jgi:hypothetical protein
MGDGGRLCDDEVATASTDHRCYMSCPAVCMFSYVPSLLLGCEVVDLDDRHARSRSRVDGVQRLSRYSSSRSSKFVQS